MIFAELVEIYSGQAQFRITETDDVKAPIYTYYSQADLDEDLSSLPNLSITSKTIRTSDTIKSLLSTGDIIFSLISGKSAIVSDAHQNFLYTQNYLRLVPKRQIDAKYLVYLLNEDSGIQKQLTFGLQGSQVLKYTSNQLKTLCLPQLPDLSIQRLIGEIYLKQRKLTALKKRVADTEMQLVLQQLKGDNTK